jgi:hypothetical protein
MFILLAGMAFQSGVTASGSGSHTLLTWLVALVLIGCVVVFMAMLALEVFRSWRFARHMGALRRRSAAVGGAVRQLSRRLSGVPLPSAGASGATTAGLSASGIGAGAGTGAGAATPTASRHQSSSSAWTTNPLRASAAPASGGTAVALVRSMSVLAPSPPPPSPPPPPPLPPRVVSTGPLRTCPSANDRSVKGLASCHSFPRIAHHTAPHTPFTHAACAATGCATLVAESAKRPSAPLDLGLHCVAPPVPGDSTAVASGSDHAAVTFTAASPPPVSARGPVVAMTRVASPCTAAGRGGSAPLPPPSPPSLAATVAGGATDDGGGGSSSRSTSADVASAVPTDGHRGDRIARMRSPMAPPRASTAGT